MTMVRVRAARVGLFGTAAGAAGAGAVLDPRLTAGGAAGLFAITIALLVGPRLQKAFLIALGVILVGYACFTRGFAYLGFPPIYVGEMTLALGLLAALAGASVRSLRYPVIWLLGLLAVWGAVRTAPYLGEYGLNALRDATIWGYGVFAVLVSSFLLNTGWLSRVPRHYSRWLRVYPYWVLLSGALSRLAPDLVPNVPGTNVPLAYFKGGDMAVHLAGCAAFVLLGLGRAPGRSGSPEAGAVGFNWWLAWGVACLILVSASRASLAVVLVTVAIVVLVTPARRWAAIATVVAVLVTLSLLIDVQVQIRPGRYIRPQQVIANLTGTFETSENGELEGPRQWREEFWRKIVSYTIFGTYFWTGKGFGINLADADGFQVTDDHSLRSPHNGSLTFLARSGVPGFALWILLQLAFGVSVFRAYLRARSTGPASRASLCLWVLIYWIAFLINSSFDVYLEGPPGGIWFWSLIGAGIALVHEQRPKDEVLGARVTRWAGVGDATPAAR